MEPELLIQSSALLGFEAVVRESGADPNSLLASVGLCLSDIYRDEHWITVKSFAQLLHTSAKTLGQDDFGMRLGIQQGFQILGTLGVLLQNCETYGDALIAVNSRLPYHNQAEIWQLLHKGEQAHLHRLDLLHDFQDKLQFKELTIAVCLNLIRLSLNGRVPDLRVELSHSPLAAAASYQAHFKAPVAFNCAHDAVIFPARYLSEPVTDANSTTLQLVEKQIAAVQSKRHRSFKQEVAILIQQSMRAHPPTIEHIAQLMNMNKRTLQRRLKCEGEDFKTLLAEVREKTACWYLSSSNIDITLLADLLGYSDISSFSRAFKAITGLSPQQWRAEK